MTTRHDIITIVAGLPRSGTSMMMQMIAAGGIEPLTDAVRAADEDNPRGYFEFEPVKRTRDDASWLEQAGGRVVKMVHVLLRDLPDDRTYRVVFMRRDLREVVASQAVMLERQGRTGANLTADRLIAAYERQLDEVRAWMDGRPNVSSVLVDYNELLSNPGPIVDSIAAFLGEGRAGGLDAEAMRAVIDPALHRQRS